MMTTDDFDGGDESVGDSDDDNDESVDMTSPSVTFMTTSSMVVTSPLATRGMMTMTSPLI